ncbi:uncharacterized protein LOC123541501 [Mercenaria mercenaria]|uniref:uncharacterized protein LOC123541501 n=1 Tax=Mercenaria mercenaria TaxID=6596 RepID=UPI00234F8A33|nr:uncharacterized protein LOC123541501 [Mercenaria mercenaria]
MTPTMLLLLLIADCSIQTLNAWKSCLFCSDVVTPTDCSRIQRCGPNEECFTDMYVTAVGGTRYNLGCRDTRQCTRAQADFEDMGNIMICSECCSGNVCNNAGCKYKGYPSPRGPICNNCALQADIDDCDKITMCQQDEVCMLQKAFNPATHESRYKTHCEKEAVCYDKIQKLKRAIESIVGKRQTQNILRYGGGPCLMKCCDTDMCNNNCNGTSQSDYIAN